MPESLTEVLLDNKDLPSETVHVISIAHEERETSYESDTLTSCCPPHMVYIAVIIYAVLASTTTRGDVSYIFERNAKCLQSRTESMEVKELWSKIPMIINQCSERRFLRIRGYRNLDETKIHVMPSEVAFLSEYACSIVSLGVGRDVAAETKMKKDMPLCSFYGADPIREPNQEMFEQVGEFFHIAVGGKNGTSQATVLEPDTGNYRVRRVRHVDIATFLRSFIQKQIIDQLMIDIEWDEYAVLPFLLKSGDIENANVVICQINIEIHNPNYAQKSIFFSTFSSKIWKKLDTCH
ncbi:unnamed protein product [Cylicocyclus nassatus]|uniref:Methyltransferase FkbM domain-containing protein n=1 Tax=Cylicocyclus nassatus TaxID=53992 RepID=A0AA36MAK9_CYLNA|nr:unnamed protein product [Cylicocyclus nassatus]